MKTLAGGKKKKNEKRKLRNFGRIRGSKEEQTKKQLRERSLLTRGLKAHLGYYVKALRNLGS